MGMYIKRMVVWCLFVARVLSAAELRVDLSSVPSGGLPPGFTPALCGEGQDPHWVVKMADDVGVGTEQDTPINQMTRHRYVLAQVSDDPTDERFPLLIYEPQVMSDLELAVRLRVIGGKIAQMAGIAFRLQNPSNFYVIRLSVSGQNLKFYKVVNGLRGEQIGPTLPLTTGRWYQLKIECKGNRIKAWLDNREVLPDLFDNTFARGKVALWTKSDSIAEFADLEVSYVPIEWPVKKILRNASEKFARAVGIHLIGRPPGSTNLQVIATTDFSRDLSSVLKECAETIKTGQAFISIGKKTTIVLLPVRDRNGDPIAVAEIELKNDTNTNGTKCAISCDARCAIYSIAYKRRERSV